ncbi:methyltransferase domain-containing protein [Amycolatopsis sp. H20-H5]|uniref:methyltransferase domain-containing protein n=1 Tax=Amycolatopsis sp. H20-H5 TaxID=3046309 RepID=UPI002DB916C0|nr:methyltransferase domain-containing protein [Amycolatopsis sp. H20-H5]MEC3977143.1 methyltransferase domain-containing protein [Amycolatopsis sp. H20-H5]
MSIENLLALLDRADTLPGAAAHRARSYELLEPGRGARVADVGCGGGRAVRELLGRGCRAVGVDVDERMLDAARKRCPSGEFVLAPADRLPFGDGELHGYRADKVLHEIPDPAPVLTEARRVLAPGGRIVLTGQDWDAFVLESDDPGLTREILRAHADLIARPRAARSYRTWLLDHGFTRVSAEVRASVFTGDTLLPMLSGVVDSVRAAGVITAEQARGWLGEQAERARADRLFLMIPLVTAAASRP